MARSTVADSRCHSMHSTAVFVLHLVGTPPSFFIVCFRSEGCDNTVHPAVLEEKVLCRRQEWMRLEREAAVPVPLTMVQCCSSWAGQTVAPAAPPFGLPHVAAAAA